ncbi:uncharacterized protein EV420DRAFT_1341097 [Desarmillaria tabescens]|uniref:Uncharacterized protein n=1 Tax=Armillaria tabescens TaxID=1929756 RepID=A0AA39JHK3_ARMTA|nr:uncharacterized protein EV420DRAFT_1341097 [Desarmillaria tabescens]KAK0442287.1 hypothetical protein EV420DRAFT_1341097 [Desarmillaria tabescens]
MDLVSLLISCNILQINRADGEHRTRILPLGCDGHQMLVSRRIRILPQLCLFNGFAGLSHCVQEPVMARTGLFVGRLCRSVLEGGG